MVSAKASYPYIFRRMCDDRELVAIDIIRHQQWTDGMTRSETSRLKDMTLPFKGKIDASPFIRGDTSLPRRIQCFSVQVSYAQLDTNDVQFIRTRTDELEGVRWDIWLIFDQLLSL